VSARPPYGSPPEGTFGRPFGERRPPGLPSSVRGASSTEFGEWLLELLLRALGLWGTATGIAMWSLAHNESRARVGRPTSTYNTLPEQERGGAKYVSAWGLWQYNRDAWRGLWEPKDYLGGATVAAGARQSQPYEATVVQEVYWPIRRYALLAQYLQTTGRNDPLGTAISIRVLHSGSGRLRDWLRVYRPGDNAQRAWSEWSRTSEWARSHNDIFEQFESAQRRQQGTA
jgi:hypothetical protein